MEQHRGGAAQCGSRSHDVVHEKNPPSGSFLRMQADKGSPDVAHPFRIGESDLGWSVAGPAKKTAGNGDRQQIRQRRREELGLVEAPFPPPPGMQRDRAEKIYLVPSPRRKDRTRHERSQKRREVTPAVEFELLHDPGQFPFVVAERARACEGRRIGNALRAEVIRTGIEAVKGEPARGTQRRLDAEGEHLAPARVTDAAILLTCDGGVADEAGLRVQEIQNRIGQQPRPGGKAVPSGRDKRSGIQRSALGGADQFPSLPFSASPWHCMQWRAQGTASRRFGWIGLPQWTHSP
jgi:hypothetical protein